MESPTASKYPDRDGLPLSQLSPQRVNGRSKVMSSPIRKELFLQQQSPSLPDFSRGYTDVSGLVKRFEHLDVRDRDAENRRKDEALARAKIACEEAETEARQCKEELRVQKKDYEESRVRERTACKRIDALMDEFARAKEQWSGQTNIYEKEVRRARKEAFKSSSVVLKLQEENKHINNELSDVKTKLDLAQRKGDKSEEERFTAQYQLVAVQEELEKLQATLRIVQEEREALKRSLHEDELVRMAADGLLVLPTDPREGDTTMTELHPESIRQPVSTTAQDNDMDLLVERRHRQAAQDLIEFMRLECKFKCCSCAKSSRSSRRSTSRTLEAPMPVRSDRTPGPAAKASELYNLSRGSEILVPAASHGHQMSTSPIELQGRQGPSRTVRSQSSDTSANEQQLPEASTPDSTAKTAKTSSVYTTVQRAVEDELMEDDREVIQDDSSEHTTIISVIRRPSLGMNITDHDLITEQVSNNSKQRSNADVFGESSAPQSSRLSQVRPSSVQLDNSLTISDEPVVIQQASQDVDNPVTALDRKSSTQPTSLRLITKPASDESNEAMPTNFSPSKDKDYPFDREAALAAIAYRRDRTKSFAQNTPRRTPSTRDRRDISAPMA